MYLPIGIGGAVAGSAAGFFLNSTAPVRGHRDLIATIAGGAGATASLAGLGAMAYAIKTGSESGAIAGAKYGALALGIGVATLGAALGFEALQRTSLHG